jgi:hypothetical protein
VSEFNFVRLLKTMVLNGQISFALFDQELLARYETADSERREQFRNAIMQEMLIAERLARILGNLCTSSEPPA